MYTLLNAALLSSSSSAAGKNEGISLGGGDGDRVGKRALSLFGGTAAAFDLTSESESEPESESLSLESESLELEELEEDEDAEDEDAADEAAAPSTSIFSASSSLSELLSSLLESVAYDAALLLLLRGRLVACAGCSAAMVVWEERKYDLERG